MAIGNTYRTAQRGMAETALGDTKRSSLTGEDQLLSSPPRKVALAALQAQKRQGYVQGHPAPFIPSSIHHLTAGRR